MASEVGVPQQAPPPPAPQSRPPPAGGGDNSALIKSLLANKVTHLEDLPIDAFKAEQVIPEHHFFLPTRENWYHKPSPIIFNIVMMLEARSAFPNCPDMNSSDNFTTNRLLNILLRYNYGFVHLEI